MENLAENFDYKEGAYRVPKLFVCSFKWLWRCKAMCDFPQVKINSQKVGFHSGVITWGEYWTVNPMLRRRVPY